MIRVVIADDHPVVREGLRQIVSRTAGMIPVGEAEDGDRLLAFLEREHADVVLLDISMPGPPCLRILERLATEHPATRAVVVTAHDEKAFAARMLEAGAYAFLRKDTGPEHLVEAIRRAAEGRRYVTPSVGERLAEALHGGPTASHQSLSPREFEVLRLMVAGVGTKQIAARMGISPKTVSTYRARIKEKLGLTSQAEILRYGMREGLE